LVQRLLERGKTSGRIDDQDEIRNRYQEYNENGAFNGLLQNQNKYFAVNGIGSITEITERVSSVIDQL
jgi:adenylate kinase